MTRLRRSSRPRAGSIPATRRRTSSTAGASASSRADSRPSMTAPRSSSRDEERAKLEAEGRKPHWRFKLDQRRVEWNDLIRGPQHIDTASLSDPVLVREDGSYLYTLPSVVDDIDLRHHACDPRRGPCRQHGGADRDLRGAWRHGPAFRASQPADRRRRQGPVEAARLAVDRVAARSRASKPWRWSATRHCSARPSRSIPAPIISELIEGFDLGKLSRAPARFDEAELRHLNAKLLHMLPYEAVKDRLGFGNEAFWLAVRGNLACSPMRRSGGMS